MTTLLDVQDVKVHFPIHGGIFWRKIGTVYAVDGVSFALKRGETLGIVGESGCGKSTLGRSLIQVIRPTAGRVVFKDQELQNLSRRQIRPLLRQVGMVFQDPFDSLNSRHSVESIITAPMQVHNVGRRQDRRDRAAELLKKVGLNTDALRKFPHEFSGGQRQRMSIARAIALNPELLICDEPVSALDVSVQAQVLNILLNLQKEMGLSCLFIAHNLAVVRHMSDRIAIMYLGKFVETGTAEDIFSRPQHPYTQLLLDSIPEIREKKGARSNKGEPPSPLAPPPGCPFHPRCPLATEECSQQTPTLRPLEPNSGHRVACIKVKTV